MLEEAEKLALLEIDNPEMDREVKAKGQRS